MGWGRTLLLGDIGNRLDIGDCEQDIANLAAGLTRQGQVDSGQDARIATLEAENRELKLYLAAVIRLLVARGAMDADEFARLIDVIDRADGAADGQFGGDIAQRDTWTGPDKPQAEDE
jgi:hypothetical protein